MSSTNHYSFVTSYQRISSESLHTRANGTMITNFTVCVLSTSSNTGISAVEIEAGQAAWALVVVLTLSFLTGDKWITLESCWTFACRCASCGDTLGIRSTWVGVAWVRLFLAACDSVRHWYIAGNTLAYWVSLPVDITSGVRSTRTWEAWVWGRGSGLDLSTPSYGIWLRGVS